MSISVDMPIVFCFVFWCRLTFPVMKYITIFFPIFMILCTAGTVLFSDEGLFENISIYEKILRFEKRTQKIQEENEDLKRKIFVLKLRKEICQTWYLIEARP